MTDKTPESVRLVAVTNVTVDGSHHAPGAAFEAPAAFADDLIAAGAAQPAEDEDADGGDLKDVKGIGPRTEAQLQDAAVADLADLAALDGDDLVRVAEALDEKPDTVAGWRDQARELRSAQ